MKGERYVPQDLFKQVMSAFRLEKKRPISKPASVEEAKIVYGSNPFMLASSSTPSSMKRTELFVKGTLPKEMAEEIRLEAPTKLKLITMKRKSQLH